MTVADTAAVKTLVQSVGNLSTATYVTLVPEGVNPGLPYVIIHPADGEDTTDRVTGPKITTHPAFTLHIVGGNAESVQTVTGLIKAEFISNGRGIPVTVSGRSNRPPYWRSPIPLQTDRDVTPWLVYQVIELGWISDPT